MSGTLAEQANVIGIQNPVDDLYAAHGAARESALFAVGAVVGYCVLERDAKSVRKLSVNLRRGQF